jgi:DNA ligase-1
MEKPMNHCDSIIRILRDHNSRLDKEAIIQAELEADNAELFEGLRMAFDPMITFGVKKVPIHGGGEGQGLPWEAFKELAQTLALRRLTGHAARDAIELALGASTKSQWNDWYRLILIKDPKAGIGETTVNKVVAKFNKPEYAIPLFECMLAHDGAKNENHVQGRKLLEPKLDGVRVITVINVDNRTAIMYSRNGKLLENFSHITTAIEQHIDLFERSMVLDGEMVSSSFQALMKQVHRKSGVQSTDARLMLFDLLPLHEFQNGISTMGQRRRSNLLKSMKAIFDQIGSIDIIPQKEVDLSSYVGELEFKQYNKDAIESGYEGIMIKDIDAEYECKRSRSWLKMKPYIEVSLEVRDVEEGTGRNMGRLGALVCSGQDDGKDIVVNCGSGFSDTDRIEYWDSRDSLPGQIVEVRADAITQNQDGTYSLRFPRFLRFRGFVAGEKL